MVFVNPSFLLLKDVSCYLLKIFLLLPRVEMMGAPFVLNMYPFKNCLKRCLIFLKGQQLLLSFLPCPPCPPRHLGGVETLWLAGFAHIFQM